MIVLVAICLITTTGIADSYKVIQITDNDYPDAGIEIYGSRLAWQAHPKKSSESEIFYYDGKNTIQLTNNNTYECMPSISSGGIVWQAYRSDKGSDVFFYDFNKIKRLTNDVKDDFRITIFNNKVVWCKSRRLEGQIMLYDGNDSTEINDAHGIFPRISSGGIMYSDILEDHLYLYDWNNIIDLGNSEVEYTQGPHNQQISGDKVVWRKYIRGCHEVFLYDISTGITKQITDGETNHPGAWTYDPSVSGNYVAWRNTKGNVNYLRLYDGERISTIVSARYMDEPYFGDGFLVWAMTDSAEDIEIYKNVRVFIGMEIFVYDLKSKEITRITNDDYSDKYPIASGGYIAWQKYDGNDYEIYLAWRREN